MEENPTRNSCLTLLNKIKEEIDCDEFRALAFLAKDHISGKRRKEYENCLELFNDLEKKSCHQMRSGRKNQLGFLRAGVLSYGEKRSCVINQTQSWRRATGTVRQMDICKRKKVSLNLFY